MVECAVSSLPHRNMMRDADGGERSAPSERVRRSNFFRVGF